MIWSLAVQGHQSLFKALPKTESLAIFKVINLISPMENERNMEISSENGILQRLQALENRERRIEQLEKQNEELRNKIEQLEIKEQLEEEYWIQAAEARNYGNCELPETVRDLFSEDSLRNRKDLRCIYKCLNEYPEPRGGWLKAQIMDQKLMDEPYINNEDKGLYEAQQCLLRTIKPLLAVEFTMLDESQTDEEKLAVIRKINRDSIRFNLHYAQEVRVTRRMQAARKFNPPIKSDSCQTIGSSDDSLLFGPELRAALRDEQLLELSRKKATAAGKGPTGSAARKWSGNQRNGATNRFQYNKQRYQSHQPANSQATSNQSSSAK